MSDQPMFIGQRVVVNGDVQFTGTLLSYDCYGVMLKDPTPGSTGIMLIPWQRITWVEVDFPRGVGRAA